MQQQTLEEWQNLCEQAAGEGDSKRLLELVRQINEMLDEKRKRAQQPSSAEKGAA
jgi:hypothetical protein